MSGEEPIKAWLHIGPNSQASICVSWPATRGKRPIILTQVQARKLSAALRNGIGIINSDDGERVRKVAIDLMKGIDE